MGDLHVSWTDYHRDIERLAAKVHAEGRQFDQIVCVARGGLRVGDTLSRIFKVPLAIISTMTSESLGERLLLVDDLVDSGVTLEVVKRHLLESRPKVKEVRTAVLWYKACSQCKPDYYVHYLPGNPWIHQPSEPYDLMSPSDLPSCTS